MSVAKAMLTITIGGEFHLTLLPDAGARCALALEVLEGVLEPRDVVLEKAIEFVGARSGDEAVHQHRRMTQMR